MTNNTSNGNGVEGIVSDFVTRITDSIQQEVRVRIQAALSMLHQTAAAGTPQALAPVRKRARVLCPVPECQNTAAPVFGMVCSEHRGLPKAQVKQYRELRKLEKR